MKKLLFLALCLALLLSSVACNGRALDTDAAETSGQEDIISTVEDESYKDVSHISSTGYAYRYLGFKDDNCTLALLLPKEWETVKCTDGYTIRRDGQDIGLITQDPDRLKLTGDCVFQKDTDLGNRSTSARILRRMLDGEKQFYYSVAYEYKAGDGAMRSFYIEADYVHTSRLVQEKLTVSTEIRDRSTDAGIGSLQSSKSDPRILILGNSFIASSSVGDIFKSISKNYGVKAVSIGYATVYRDEQTYLEYIREGSYDYVFLCGYYSSDATEPTGRIYDACKAKGAQLVIFPAHNENDSAINDAKRKYPDIPILHWKSEIDALIRSGIDRSYMCINDSHGHSTELAGYVGAHMIYRAIYGKLPAKTDLGYASSLDVARLGDYVSTGTVCLIQDSQILFLD